MEKVTLSPKTPFGEYQTFYKTSITSHEKSLQITVPWKGFDALVFIAEKLWIAKNVRDLYGINDFDPIAHSLPSHTQ